MTKRIAAVLLGILSLTCVTAGAEPEPNRWSRVDSDLGPGFSPGLVWSPELKRFVFFCGAVSHQFTGERPYDVLSFDPTDRKWRNELPKDALNRGGETGNVKDVPFKSPYYAFGDNEGLQRPNRRHTCMWNHYTIAPWDGKVYALVCGRVLSYDPKERIWKETGAPAGPMPLAEGHRVSLSWSALCADPVNQEILLFGGCGVTTPDGSPGTWVFSPKQNEWRKLDLKTQPPPRALSPLVFDPKTRKIVLFGGDRLDQLYADTWVYDCATRSWEEKKPAVSPAPRFGHALLRLPKTGQLVLVGGKGYSSTTAYNALLYKSLPFETWTYDVERNEWALLNRLEKDAPAQVANGAGCAAVADDDNVLFIGGPDAGAAKGVVHSAWLCRLDPAKVDAAGTAKFGVKPGTVEVRTGSFDPEWYTKDVPPADPKAVAAVLEKLPANSWTALVCPRWPENRQTGGWSTVTLDTDRDELLHMSGGHSSYFGNDMAHYDIKTGRWSIATRPQFALEFNYDLTGPGLWAFNGAPWGNHNYHCYAYDPTIKRVVYVKGSRALLYDPVTRTWPHAEKFDKLPFHVSKYTNYFCTTPKGVHCWTQRLGDQSRFGLWRLEDGKVWKEVKTTGAPLPRPETDGSTITYDSRRERLLITTTTGKDGPHGQVWSADLKTGEVKALNPAGMDLIKGNRFARESVYLPKSDLVMIGYLLPVDGGTAVPFYDCENNRWLTARMPGADFMNRGKPGASVDLGLVYDPKRDLVWATLCTLRPGSLQAVRVDAATLGAQPLK